MAELKTLTELIAEARTRKEGREAAAAAEAQLKREREEQAKVDALRARMHRLLGEELTGTLLDAQYGIADPFGERDAYVLLHADEFSVIGTTCVTRTGFAAYGIAFSFCGYSEDAPFDLGAMPQADRLRLFERGRVEESLTETQEQFLCWLGERADVYRAAERAAREDGAGGHEDTSDDDPF